MVRLTTVPLSSISRSRSSAHGSSTRRYSSGGGSCGGPGTRRDASASSGTIHGADRRGERLAQERAQRLVLPALDRARAPVVDEHEAEDVLGGVGRGDRRAQLRARAGDEAELELDVQARLGTERRGAAGLGRRALAARAPDRRAADHDRAGAPVVADRQVAPVRQQRVAVGAEHAPQVGRVLDRGVEVDVVADVDRQPRLERRRARIAGQLRARRRRARRGASASRSRPGGPARGSG